MSKYGKCDEGFRILEYFVCQAILGSPKIIGFKVGRSCPRSIGIDGHGSEIDTKANHGLGQVRVRFDDGREQAVALETAMLEKVEKSTGAG